MKYKKHLLLFILCLFVHSISNASYTYHLNLKDSTISFNTIQNVQRTIITSNNTKQITVEYSIPSISIFQDSITSLNKISIDQFHIIKDENRPAILARGDCFEIPDNHNLSLTLLDCEFVDLYLPLNNTESFAQTTGDNIKDDTIFNFDGFYPGNPVSIAEKICYKGHNIQYINVVPTSYNSRTSTLRVYTKLSYEINFQPLSNNLLNSKRTKPISQTPDEDETFLSSILTYYNNENISLKEARDGAQMIPAPDLLIVTHSSLLPAVTKYAEWKKLTGLNVSIFSGYNWTYEDIKEQLDAFYEYKYPLGLLIVGSSNLVPTKKLSDETFSDISYACADGEDDIYPDVMYSRIPAQSNSEAEGVFNKLISYDQSGLLDKNAYNKILGAGSFDPGPGNSNENKSYYDIATYIENLEDVGNYISSQGFEYIRQYYCPPFVLPTYFNNGLPLPDYLMKPNYSWNADCASIREAIDNGVNLIIYRGHGNANGWLHNNRELSYLFTAPESRLLTNADNYPLMLCLTCLNGQFSQGVVPSMCFANESFIYNRKGCMGVFASGSSVATPFGDILSKAWANVLLPDPGIESLYDHSTRSTTYSKGITPPRFRIGDILNNVWSSIQSTSRSLNSSDKYFFEVRGSYNFFGDATMDYYWTKPAKGVYTKSLYFNNTYMQIDTPLNSTLVLYNPEKDLVTYGYGKTMVYQNNNANTVNQMCFSVRPYRGLPAYFDNGKISFNNFEVDESFLFYNIDSISQEDNFLKIKLSNFNNNVIDDIYINIANALTNNSILNARVTNSDIIIENIDQGFYIVTLYKNGTPYEVKKLVVK